MEKQLKRIFILCNEDERELIEKLAEIEGVGEISNAVRLAIREALEKRGVEIPDNSFVRKKEGRPKESALTSLLTSRAA